MTEQASAKSRRFSVVQESNTMTDTEWEQLLTRHGAHKESPPDTETEATPQPEVTAPVPRPDGRKKPDAYTAQLLVQVTLPHSKPEPGQNVYERRNGNQRLIVLADPKYGLPYGTYPRLLMAFIVTEVVRSKSPDIELGKSLRAFLRSLGIPCGGGPRGSAPRVREHMQRLFTSTIAAERFQDGKWVRVGFCPVEKVEAFWDPESPNNMEKWQASIRLNQTFVNEILRAPVPMHLHALRYLSKTRSPMALDIYQWLTYRMSYVTKRTVIPWQHLQLQFGGSYKHLRQFKVGFTQQLKLVTSDEVYKSAKVEVTPDGLVLYPSPTHALMLVKPKKKRITTS